ncbi:MAG: GFA family protein [Aquabacterium sp.]|uniref:GFA family protein n=1 Tax=Aquabacterium sp. TaxID=1872578 RepID=UPI00122843EB|nr:GFA family protein [Aquabacterium sp.]TAK97019.1 MAG: GFA family protein [Aquabacterium sp.]
MNTNTGSCLCGGIRFRIRGELPPIQICYCSQCRKAQGAAFASNVPVQSCNFELVGGQDLMKAYEATPGKRRWFCGCCGSPIYSERDSLPGVLRVRIGTVDEPIQARPAFHAHVESKCSWWELPDDGLPRYPQWPEP